ncbi:MAG: oligoendopeptidase F [Chloroflexota bacterium]|nr:oligoendopeptidase F [Chloroflexota bacterium]
MTATIEQSDVLTRDQITLEDTWDLSTIFASDDAWTTEAAGVASLLAGATGHRGHLGESAGRLGQALDDVMRVRLAMERLAVYAMLRRDEDQTDNEAQARYERVTALSIEVGEALAFFEPELLALPEERLDTLVNDPHLTRYHHLLADLQRNRPHVRSIEVEELLAQGADISRATADAFGALDNADLDYGQVRDDAGNEITLTKARYAVLLRSRDRAVRREASDTFMTAYLDHKHTLAALHGASVRKDVFHAKARRHPSAREAALFGGNIPTAVYDNLIAVVTKAKPVLARFLELRRKVLGVEQLEAYDLQVPLSTEPDRAYSYRDAVDIVLSGLTPLGDRYVNDLRAGFNQRWVDVYETKGKRSGAYSWGAYGSPPVMLMNWNGTIRDVFTLAHEAGHAMHSFYADAARPYHDAGYPIFLAEVASTVNEALLTWHLLDDTGADETEARFALYNHFADDFYGTVVRQTQFAAFEQWTHEQVESGQPLTLDALNAKYGELNEQFVPGVAVDDKLRLSWGRIPHFYRAFYVYQYATGMSAALTLARAVVDDGAPAQRRYLDLLAAGGSDYPLPLLQKAGVDLTAPEPIETGLAEFERVVTEMEAMVAARPGAAK